MSFTKIWTQKEKKKERRKIWTNGPSTFQAYLGDISGGVWYCYLNSSFQYLNYITRIKNNNNIIRNLLPNGIVTFF